MAFFTYSNERYSPCLFHNGILPPGRLFYSHQSHTAGDNAAPDALLAAL
jgi:hypothetical protein